MEFVSPAGQWQVCLLPSKIKTMCRVLSTDAHPLPAQRLRAARRETGRKRNQSRTKLRLPGSVNTFVSDPGIACLLPEFMKLWQAKCLAHKSGKNLKPFTVLNIWKILLNLVLLLLLKI